MLCFVLLLPLCKDGALGAVLKRLRHHRGQRRAVELTALTLLAQAKADMDALSHSHT